MKQRTLNNVVDDIFMERLRRKLNRVPGGNQEFDEAMTVLLGVCNGLFASPDDALHGLICALQAVSCYTADGDDELSEKVLGIACEATKAAWKRDGKAYVVAIRQLQVLQMMDGASKH